MLGVQPGTSQNAHNKMLMRAGHSSLPFMATRLIKTKATCSVSELIHESESLFSMRPLWALCLTPSVALFSQNNFRLSPLKALKKDYLNYTYACVFIGSQSWPQKQFPLKSLFPFRNLSFRAKPNEEET